MASSIHKNRGCPDKILMYKSAIVRGPANEFVTGARGEMSSEIPTPSKMMDSVNH